MADQAGSCGRSFSRLDAEMRFHSSTAEPVPSASTREIKMKDVYRKCCSCHMMKAFIDVRGVQRKRDFGNHKLQWCCLECMSLKKRIARLQDSARAILGWNDIRRRSGVPSWDDIRKNESARFMEQAAGLMKDDLRKAMSDAVRRLRKKKKALLKAERRRKKSKAKAKAKSHAQASSGKALDKGSIADTGAGEKAESAASTEPVVKRKRPNVKRPKEKKPEDEVLRETSMKKLTQKQNDRLVCVRGKLQETSLLLHAWIREVSKHRGTKVPINTLEKVKAVTADILKLVTMASDMHATGKTPQAMFSSVFQDAKHAIEVAKEVFAKMSSLIVD